MNTAAIRLAKRDGCFRPMHAMHCVTTSLLIGMHIAAALYHDLVWHDDALAGMLPGMQPLPQPGPPGQSLTPF